VHVTGNAMGATNIEPLLYIGISGCFCVEVQYPHLAENRSAEQFLRFSAKFNENYILQNYCYEIPRNYDKVAK
jgi:hypothetical protein